MTADFEKYLDKLKYPHVADEEIKTKVPFRRQKRGKGVFDQARANEVPRDPYCWRFIRDMVLDDTLSTPEMLKALAAVSALSYLYGRTSVTSTAPTSTTTLSPLARSPRPETMLSRSLAVPSGMSRLLLRTP
jgi:hypothetical protein